MLVLSKLCATVFLLRGDDGQGSLSVERPSHLAHVTQHGPYVVLVISRHGGTVRVQSAPQSSVCLHTHSGLDVLARRLLDLDRPSS